MLSVKAEILLESQLSSPYFLDIFSIFQEVQILIAY